MIIPKPSHLALIAGLCFIAGIARGEEPKKIPASSIGIDFVLVGQSGLPLGTRFSAEAMLVVEKAKHQKEGDSRFLLIRKINGEELKEPKKIRLWDDTEFKEGEWKKMEVIEDAQYSLSFTPNLNVDEAKEDKGTQVIYTGIKIIGLTEDGKRPNP